MSPARWRSFLAAHVGTEVELDSPTTPKGDNPDVIFTATEESRDAAARRWALAIKTISTTQGQTIFDRIKSGAKQIDRPQCQADIGMVIINAKDALCHKHLWEASFADIDQAIAALRAELDELVASAQASRLQKEWDELFLGKVVRPVIFMGQSVVRLPTSAGRQTPTALKMFRPYEIGGVNDVVGVSLACCMNEFMQTVLQGVPGSNGRLPY
jgi:hypothetical protein